MTTPLRRTPLHDRHAAAGAKLVPFAGWEMPIEYAGVKQEHLAVRSSAGLFDVSHMGQIICRGPGAKELLQRLTSNDVEKLTAGGAQYSVLLRDDGGVLDDLFTYRLDTDLYLTVTNAANHERDLAWFQEHVGDLDVAVEDHIDNFAMIAVQGPRAREIVQALSDAPLPERMTVRPRTLRGYLTLVAGTGYTGEDGVEILCEPRAAGTIWDALVTRGAKPIGLGARDTLRLEACFHLYGNDLSEERGPIEAGLGWACKEATGFIGSDATRAAREAGGAPDGLKLVPFRLTSRGIPRPGNAVVGGGEVTSGTYSPSLEVGIGFAYVPVDHAEPGTAFEIDVRGTTRRAEVATKPLYVPAAR